MILSLFIFFLTATLLYLSSSRLLNHLIKLFTKIFHSQSVGLNIVFYLLLPGVFLHEFSHILTAEILQVRTGELSLKPQLKEGGIQFGSAQIAITDPIRLTFIGTAPFIAGILALFAILTFGLHLDLSSFSLTYLFQSLSTVSTFFLVLSFYLLFAIGNTMFSSPSDLQAAGLPAILVLILLGSLKLLNINLHPSIIDSINSFFYLLSLVFSLNLAINLTLLLPLSLVKKH